MASQFSQDAERTALAQMAEAGFTPSGLERYKLDRLRELRAVIATLRGESDHPASTPNRTFEGMRVNHA